MDGFAVVVRSLDFMLFDTAFKKNYYWHVIHAYGYVCMPQCTHERQGATGELSLPTVRSRDQRRPSGLPGKWL